jgi:hypothetical protein
MMKRQLTVHSENRPGSLARIARVLSAAKVNIEAISFCENTDAGLVRIVPSHPVKAEKALRRAKLAYTVQKVALLSLRNEPGALARVTADVAKAGVNIEYTYGSVCGCGCDCECMLVVSASDLKKLTSIWKP